MATFGTTAGRRAVLACVFAVSACAPISRPGPDANPPSRFDGGGYAVETCDASYAGRAASCTISGGGTGIALRSNVISGDRILIGGTLLTDVDGRVAYVGCTPPSVADRTGVDCPGALVSPGLINLHEHIDYSYQQPPAPPSLKWRHRNEWRALAAPARGFEGDAPANESVRADVSKRAMLRHALSGETAIAGAKSYSAFLRNLRLGGTMGTPGERAVIDSTFPLNDAVSMAVPSTPCTAAERAAVKFDPASPLLAHVGEGNGTGARLEVDCMLGAIAGKPAPTAFVHGVAIDPAQAERLRQQNVAVVLSPRSNLELYGTTAPIPALRSAGVTLALGTDWSPSGSLTMLDEARCLARYDRDQLQHLLSAAEVHRMMTSGAARAIGLEGRIGALAPGESADLVIFDTEGRTSLAEILEQSALPQTLAVLIAGRVASAPAAWAGRLPQLANCSVDPRSLCGASRLVCGGDAERPLAKLLEPSVYTIDDTKLCRPQPTDDCVAR